ncbi:ATP-binding protein [Rhizobium ruizarguesonis]
MANVRLKDIIGKGLINNSNIAIIELIKNAKDAGSPRVDLVFSNADKGGAGSTIVVSDEGSGMTLEDIRLKWLNIAYSEKRGGKKEGRGYYAGEKGIGRFSCDRLGKSLDLYTRAHGTEWAHLHIDWENFEIDDQDKQISDILLHPRYLKPNEVAQIPQITDATSNGTILVIGDLRETWREPELKKLQKELERFIVDPRGEFAVYLKSMDFLGPKKELLFEGRISNRLLENIDNKTIFVLSKISEDGNTISNSIHHLGDQILSYDMDNPYGALKDVSARIYYLSQGAKVSFKTMTGYSSTDYGSIMLFLNGFRVMPYGEPKDDWLQLNERKAQGNSRYLGTRELFGRVEINDNDRAFVPVSSREGLAHNVAFGELSDDGSVQPGISYAYLSMVVRTLEKYVVGGMDWDRIAPGNRDFSYDDLLAAVHSIVRTSGKASAYRNVVINETVLRRIAQEKVEEVKGFVEELLEKVADKSVYELTKSEQRDLKRYVERHEVAMAAKADVVDVFRERANVESKRRLFAEAHLGSDSKRITEIQHLIGLWGGRIEDDIRDSLDRIARGDIAEATQLLQGSYLLAKKISKLSAIVTKANFNLMTDSISLDVFQYVRDYIGEIRDLNADIRSNLGITFKNLGETVLQLNFSPLEVSMLIDNAISNSTKMDARTIAVLAHSDGSYHYLDIEDDGKPLDPRYSPDELFLEGITTTDGSGIGLSHVKGIASRLDAVPTIFSNKRGGTTLRIRWDL